MRDSSRTRPSSSSALHAAAGDRAVARSCATTRCRSANAATCGRWVTTTTWAVRASRASRRPTSTAAWPPTPASTSSNTNVGTGSAPAKTTSTASITRDSSPPDAPRCSGRGRRAGVRAQQQLDVVDAVRAEREPPAGHLEAVGLVGLRDGDRDAARAASRGRRSSAVTAAAKRGRGRAARRGQRGGERRRARRAARRSRSCSAAMRVVVAVERRPAGRPALAPRRARRPTVSPYLRVSRPSAARRSLTAASRAGSASTPAA